jgi:hypothetical protein
MSRILADPGFLFYFSIVSIEKHIIQNLKNTPMKTELHIESTPVVSRTIVKLALLGGITLALVYGILMVFANAVKIFQ